MTADKIHKIMTADKTNKVAVIFHLATSGWFAYEAIRRYLTDNTDAGFAYLLLTASWISLAACYTTIRKLYKTTRTLEKTNENLTKALVKQFYDNTSA